MGAHYYHGCFILRSMTLLFLFLIYLELCIIFICFKFLWKHVMTLNKEFKNPFVLQKLLQVFTFANNCTWNFWQVFNFENLVKIWKIREVYTCKNLCQSGANNRNNFVQLAINLISGNLRSILIVCVPWPRDI